MGDGNHYSRYIPCRMCGSMVMTTAPSTTCKECREIRDRERQRLRYSRECKSDPDSYTVVRDPDELGGFHPGAVINRIQAQYMLLESVAAFTPNTILRDRRGQLFKIVFNDHKFKMVTT